MPDQKRVYPEVVKNGHEWAKDRGLGEGNDHGHEKANECEREEENVHEREHEGEWVDEDDNIHGAKVLEGGMSSLVGVPNHLWV